MPRRAGAEPEPQDDSAPDEDSSLESTDVSELLHHFDEEEDLDDSTAGDLDAGIALPGDEEAAGMAEDLPVDVGELLAGLDDESREGSDDETGPTQPETDVDAEEEAPDAVDDGEGAGERLEDLVTGELPSLDAGPEEETGTAAPEAIVLVGDVGEDPPSRAELGWASLRIGPRGKSRTVVARGGRQLLVAGADVSVVDDAALGPELVADAGGQISSLVTGIELAAIVYTTEEGDVFRASGSTRPPERLVAWRAELSGLDPAGTRSLTLGGPTPSSRPAVLLHVPEVHALLESTDHGTTWRRVELGGRVLALSTGTPPLCLVETADGFRLFRSEPSGGFKTVDGDWPGESDSPRIAGENRVVAILEPGRGVLVSADGGSSFQRVAGSSRATAIATGRLGGRACAFTALFDEASGRGSIVWIDAASGEARIIADVEPDADDEDDERARVLSLAWDEEGETLWAAGPFGLARFRRPPSA